MRILIFFLIAVLPAIGGCAKTAPTEPSLPKTATIKDIMESMVDPSADFLFESIVTIADEKGITEKAPETDEEWHEARDRAITLVEAPNLIVMEGRMVARPGEKADEPRVELEPGQIQKLIDADRPHFIDRAKALQDAATVALSAIDHKDKKALFEALTEIDKACENCHLEYWYPNDKQSTK